MERVPLVQITDATVLSNGRHLFARTSWSIHAGEHWAIVGPNGSGKTTLAKALWDAASVVEGSISWPLAGARAVRHVTFEDRARRIARYSRYLQGRYESIEDGNAPTAAQELAAACATAAPGGFLNRSRILRSLGLDPVMDREVSRLSNGEACKLLLAEALLARPRLLVLEEPMQGLDRRSRCRLSRLLARAARAGMTIVVVTSRGCDVPRFIGRVLRVRAGEIVSGGPRTRARQPAAATPAAAPAVSSAQAPARAGPQPRPAIVELRNVTVRHGAAIVLRGVNWRIREGESWALVGPNGSGKTTLLSLVLADNPQAYANDVRLFGHPRGDGQSIWEVKAMVGHVSPEAQALLDGRLSVRQTVLDGPGGEAALRQLPALGLAGSEERSVASLSDGEKRLVLIARAMAENPRGNLRLLVLDEPCQGLDEEHRRAVLAAVEHLGRQGSVSLVYVTHEPREIPACVTRLLALRRGRAVRRPILLLRLFGA
jgi:molybdate transport system ATP-binding protein